MHIGIHQVSIMVCNNNQRCPVALKPRIISKYFEDQSLLPNPLGQPQRQG